jgi:hypothetical protein
MIKQVKMVAMTFPQHTNYWFKNYRNESFYVISYNNGFYNVVNPHENKQGNWRIPNTYCENLGIGEGKTIKEEIENLIEKLDNKIKSINQNNVKLDFDLRKVIAKNIYNEFVNENDEKITLLNKICSEKELNEKPKDKILYRLDKDYLLSCINLCL